MYIGTNFTFIERRNIDISLIPEAETSCSMLALAEILNNSERKVIKSYNALFSSPVF